MDSLATAGSSLYRNTANYDEDTKTLNGVRFMAATKKLGFTVLLWLLMKMGLEEFKGNESDELFLVLVWREVASVFSAYALKHYFDEITYIDILDCNGGDHGYPLQQALTKSTSARFLLGSYSGRNGRMSRSYVYQTWVWFPLKLEQRHIFFHHEENWISLAKNIQESNVFVSLWLLVNLI